MIIRKAILKDHPFIVDFQIRMALETEKMNLNPNVVNKGVQAVFDSSSKGQYWVAEENGTVVASLLLVPEWSDWRNGTVMWIHSVFVEPKFRGKKIFKQMYEELQNQVKKENWRGLRLYVDKTNLKAQSVYRALGMSNDHYELFEWIPR
jgi:GNAT superfamily N-acetyltransferase